MEKNTVKNLTMSIIFIMTTDWVGYYKLLTGNSKKKFER